MGKTNPLNENDLADFLEQLNGFKNSDNSWVVDLADVDSETVDLSVKNPNKNDEIVYREPKEILKEMQGLDEESSKILAKIMELV